MLQTLFLKQRMAHLKLPEKTHDMTRPVRPGRSLKISKE